MLAVAVAVVQPTVDVVVVLGHALPPVDVVMALGLRLAPIVVVLDPVDVVAPTFPRTRVVALALVRAHVLALALASGVVARAPPGPMFSVARWGPTPVLADLLSTEWMM